MNIYRYKIVDFAEGRLGSKNYNSEIMFGSLVPTYLVQLSPTESWSNEYRKSDYIQSIMTKIYTI